MSLLGGIMSCTKDRSRFQQEQQTATWNKNKTTYNVFKISSNDWYSDNNTVWWSRGWSAQKINVVFHWASSLSAYKADKYSTGNIRFSWQTAAPPTTSPFSIRDEKGKKTRPETGTRRRRSRREGGCDLHRSHPGRSANAGISSYLRHQRTRFAAPLTLNGDISSYQTVIKLNSIRLLHDLDRGVDCPG